MDRKKYGGLLLHNKEVKWSHLKKKWVGVIRNPKYNYGDTKIRRKTRDWKITKSKISRR